MATAEPGLRAMAETVLCRLCAENKTDVIGISDAEGMKLNMRNKIATFLHIEVTESDGLPQTVCIDCCVLLNQCSDFYEQTNQAQTSLRELLVDCKRRAPESPEPIIEYETKTEQYTKVDREGLANYVIESVTEVAYLNENPESDGQGVCETEEKISVGEIEETKKKSPMKKPVKQVKKNRKRKVQRKNSNSASGSDADEDQDESRGKPKIPDNYMTGTDSDKEIIETQAKDPSKMKAGQCLDRYPWLCTDCNEKFWSLEMLEKHHTSVHNQQAKYMCVQCCKVYQKYYGFVTHVRRHKTKSKFSCDVCGKSFVHQKVLNSHRAVHSEQRAHVCDICGKSFRQQSALFIHNRCHLPDTVKNRYPCDQCEKRFSTKPNLVTHQRIHSGVRNFTCDQCGKSFIQKGNLEAHFLTHSADKPFPCSQCSKAFKTALQLKKHETVHTGAKPHQCTVCGRTFREKGTLREHHRIHTGAMPFTCEFCGKSFRFKGILTTHRRQHTGERPYSCLECQHHFTNWPNYNKHMKRRHGINTSHSKHRQQLPEVPKVEANSQPELAISEHSIEPAVQIVEVEPQPIIIQTIPTTTIQTFQAELLPVAAEEIVLRQRNGSAYFNGVIPTTLQNFLPPHLPYNFYNVSTVPESDLIQPK